MKRLIFLFIISIAISFSCNQNNEQSDQVSEVQKPKNIILLIGDGMGTSQVFAGLTARADKFNIARCKHIGFQKTKSSDNYVTDSAASGTALATGSKTNNGVIGMNADGVKVKSILEIAEQKSLSTGLVATSKITHATPASFIAHNISRNNYDEIALDFLKTDVDVFIGGGRNNFNKREDGLNLIDSLKARNYFVIDTISDLQKSTENKIAGLLYGEHPPAISEGRGNMLEQASELAISALSKNEKGFFLMIEGSQIDWGGHDMSNDYVVDEMVDFDKTVGIALDFAEQNSETLVIITADHECGGYAVTGGNPVTKTVVGEFCTDHHTATMVPVFAYGPGAEEFMGVYENTDVFLKMKKLLGF